MRGVAFDDLLALAAPPSPAVEAWLLKHLGGARADGALFTVSELLDLGYTTIDELDDDDTEALVDWFERARHRALVRLLEGDEGAALGWCTDAVRCAWGWWKPVLAAAPNHRVHDVERQVEIATNDASTIDVVERARRDTSALPTRTSPPPYAGHFYGALQALLDARLAKHGATRLSHVADALSFSCVAPDGSRCSEEIASRRPVSRH